MREARPVVHVEAELRREVAYWLDVLGLTPRARAKLGVDVARAQGGAVDRHSTGPTSTARPPMADPGARSDLGGWQRSSASRSCRGRPAPLAGSNDDVGPTREYAEAARPRRRTARNLNAAVRDTVSGHIPESSQSENQKARICGPFRSG
jgi:hypothetical protein